MGLRYLIFHLSRSLKIQLLLIFLLMIFTTFTEILTIGSVIPFIVAIIDPDKIYEFEKVANFLNYVKISPENITNYALIAFLISVIIVTITNLFFLYACIKFTQSCALFLSEKVFKNYLNEDYKKILEKNSAHMLSGILQKNDSVVSILHQLLILVINTIILTCITILIFVYSPLFTLYSIVIFVFLYFILTLILKSSLKNYSYQTATLITKRTQILSETLKGFRQVILDNSRKIFEFIFKNVDQKYRSLEAKINFFSLAPRYFFEGTGMIVIALVAIYIINNNIFENADLLTYLALLGVSAQRALPKINQAYTAWSNITATQKNLIDVNELAFKKFVEKKFIPNKKFNFKDKIQFKDVSFSYSENNNKILKNINLEILKGEKIIITGESGSGKSTFLDLFLGLLAPTSGEIKIDNTKLESNNILNYQRILSSVAQTPAFLDASIAQNIVFYIDEEKIYFDKLKECSKKAEILKFIMNLENKFDTMMGENGLQLSGGQRQRISIARALYRDHEILIFDEATNSLDPDTETKIINNLLDSNKDKTLVFVTHNKKIINKFDKIYTILNGKIIQLRK